MKIWDMLKEPRKAFKKMKFIYEPYRKVRITCIDKKKRKALQRNGVEMIKILEKALSEYDVMYFADYGTLLGIIRDQNFIPWDNDMDYGILIDNSFDWMSFEKHLNRYGFDKIREFSLMGKITEQTYVYQNRMLSVDFFAKIIEGERLISYIYFRKPQYEYLSEYDTHVRKMKYAVVNKTKRVLFKEIYVNVPENEEQYLESVFSQNWKIPDPCSDVYKLKIELEELDILGKDVSI